jgi:N-succinyldiaminopimelate aminotransferase
VELRQSCADWMQRRYGLQLDAEKEVLPVNGSREALFAFVQTVVNSQQAEKPVVISPNPFYQIYEGAALLAGAEPFYVNCTASTGFQPDWASVPESVGTHPAGIRVQPGQSHRCGDVAGRLENLFALSDRYGFVIASDECYSEIHFGQPPLGGLEAASKLGRGFERLVMFTSLSKRSNAPGMRSGFVAGDAALLASFMLYRTYQGGAMSPTIQAASVAAWNDEAHVEENRAAYIAKFQAVTPCWPRCWMSACRMPASTCGPKYPVAMTPPLPVPCSNRSTLPCCQAPSWPAPPMA